VSKALVFDIETFGSEHLWDMPPAEFFRLGGFAWGAGEVQLTTDLEELRAAIRSADVVIGHNITAFDLTAVFGKDSTEPLRMAREGKVFDTWVHATLYAPAPRQYTNRKGQTRLAVSPEQAMSWFSLDNLAYQFGVAGKSHDLKALAKLHGGFGEIPTDDPEFRDYLVQDVVASRDIAKKLLKIHPFTGYAKREQLNAAIDAQNSRNGWRVDTERAKARVKELDDLRDKYMAMLAEKFGLPTEGKAPLRSNAGKAAVLAALRSVGIREKDLPKTKAGAPSLGGEGLVEAARGKGPEAEELAGAIAAIGGMRPLAQTALDCVHADGRVHPSITTLQRSGRKSTTKPGLTVWTSRGKGAIEKSYFIPNADDEVLVEFDYSQADARIVAAYSGDRKFAQRFAPGADAHLITAWAVWGKDVVGTDKSDPVTAEYRQTAKALGHAYAYRAGPRTLARTAKQPLAVAERFVKAMQAEYKLVSKWQDRAAREAETGRVVGGWGRPMMAESDRAWTQGPALKGQNGTRELIVDALIRLPDDVLCMLVAQVHDALVFSIPRGRLEEVTETVKAAMQCHWQPPDGSGQRVFFPVGVGPAATNWADAGH
jgi:DNA polymerase-1